MSKSKELSEFDRGSIVGCHLCGKSVREIAAILQKPKSIVSDVIDRGCFSWFGLGPLVPVIGNMDLQILRSRPNRPSSLQALTSVMMDAWKAIPMVTYQKLVESLPKRVQAVIHAKGGPTSY
ncbi:hypothetical protein TNCV_869741 [Trichonephila clavipes]|nr:hypothetical protein TNCV_869741 [Trichonephila clavipes]